MAVGRDAERSTIERFASGDGDLGRALVLEGVAGIGKTTLWQEGVERLRAAGALVLEARPVESETALPFAALADLLEAVDARHVEALPEAQRRALEAALQRGPADEAASLLAVARATLALLRAEAAEQDVAVAIDDAQWLDLPTARALAFALRRGPSRRVLVSRRVDGHEPPPLELGSAAGLQLQRLLIGPLPAGELGLVVSGQLDTRLPRALLLALHEISGGNPLYAVEIVRAAASTSSRPLDGKRPSYAR
jgi:hypothetical protein